MSNLEELLRKEEVGAEILKLIAPGTELRNGLENILKTKTGALIVASDAKEVLELVDRWFLYKSRLYSIKIIRIS